jgi:hypothetical protein
MKPLKILSLSEWDHAGCAYQLAEAINETTPHHCRAIKLHDNAFRYPYDMMGLTMQQITLLWKWSDVVHVHDSFPVNLPRTIPPRPIVITYHGSEYRKAWKAKNKQVEAMKWIGSVATCDLTSYGLPWLPDCRPDLTRYVNRTSTFSIAHSPTRQHRKGTAKVEEALTGLSLDIISKTTWENCLTRKGKAWLTVDQFRKGYGCSAIEAWAMGQPVVGGGEPDVMKAIEKYVGFVPFYYCAETIDDIREAVEELMTDKALYDEMTEAASLCWEKYHSPEATAARVLKLYDRALDLGAGRIVPTRPSLLTRSNKKGVLGLADGDVVEVRFIGHGTQERTIIGSESGTHYRYSGREKKAPKRNFYVYRCDLAGILRPRNKRGEPLFVRVK